MGRPASILVVDDHPALRAGLRGLLEQEPGLLFAGAVSSEQELTAALADVRPDVVVLDYVLGRGDGLSACFRIKQRSEAPGVVLYTAHAGDVFAVPAAIAQADAVVSKSAPVEELLSTIRAVAVRRVVLPRPHAELMQAVSARMTQDDLPVIGMLFARVPVAEIAETLAVTPAQIRAQALRIIGELQALDDGEPLAARREAQHVGG